jgi:hypothetical protein
MKFENYKKTLMSIAIMLVATCASSQSTIAASLEIDACKLLTATEISEVVGLPVENGIRKDEGMQENGSYSSACVWVIGREKDFLEDPEAPLGGRQFVILNAMQWPHGSGLARQFLEAFHEAAANGELPSKPTPRTFGDEALWWGDGLAVRAKDVSFGLSVFLPKRSPKRPGELEERLAPLILQRLPR